MSGRLVSQQPIKPDARGRIIIDVVTGKVTLANGAKPLVLIVDPSIAPGDNGVLRLPRQDDNFRLIDVADPSDWMTVEGPDAPCIEQPFIVCLIIPSGRVDREAIGIYADVISLVFRPAMALMIGPIGSERRLKPVALENGFAVATVPAGRADLSETLAMLLSQMIESARQDAAAAAAEAVRIKKQKNAPAEVVNLATPTNKRKRKLRATVVAKTEPQRYNTNTVANQDTLFAERESFSRYSADEIELIARKDSTLAARHERYDETRKAYAQSPTDENAASLRAAAKNLRDKQKEIGLLPETTNPLLSQAVKQLRPVADPPHPAKAPMMAKARSAALG